MPPALSSDPVRLALGALADTSSTRHQQLHGFARQLDNAYVFDVDDT
jgi:hypothetical protein